MSEEKICTYDYDCDMGLITFYVDGEEFVCWCADDGDSKDASIRDFNKILELGKSMQQSQIAELEQKLADADKIHTERARKRVDRVIRDRDNAINALKAQLEIAKQYMPKGVEII